MMRLDEVIALLPEAGLMLRNLFQRSDGNWQANVGNVVGEDAEFGIGPTPVIALLFAFGKAGVMLEDDGTSRDDLVGKWLSAALEDPAVCAEMKADILAWFG